MFGIKVRANTDNIKNYTENISVPLLILDPVWLELFPKEEKNQRMVMLEERIKSLMKEEARLREKKKSLATLKKRNMSRIMDLTVAAHEQNDSRAKNEMQHKRRDILLSNKAYRQIEMKLLNIEDEIDKANTQLLTETVTICYSVMKQSKQELKEIAPKIEKLRKELYKLLERKVDNEDKYNRTYNLLHKLVGKDIINFLDRENTYSRRRWWV